MCEDHSTLSSPPNSFPIIRSSIFEPLLYIPIQMILAYCGRFVNS